MPNTIDEKDEEYIPGHYVPPSKTKRHEHSITSGPLDSKRYRDNRDDVLFDIIEDKIGNNAANTAVDHSSGSTPNQDNNINDNNININTNSNSIKENNSEHAVPALNQGDSTSKSDLKSNVHGSHVPLMNISFKNQGTFASDIEFVKNLCRGRPGKVGDLKIVLYGYFRLDN